MILLRAIARFVALLLLLALALLGLAVALFSIQGDERALSLPTLARHLRLPELRDVTGDYLSHLEAGGPVAWISVGAAAAAIAVGILLVVGALAPRRERLVVLADEGGARLAARRRALAQLAAERVRGVRGITEERTRVRPGRRGRGGSLTIMASHSRKGSSPELEQRIAAAVAPLAEDFDLRTRVRARLGKRGSRVE